MQPNRKRKINFYKVEDISFNIDSSRIQGGVCLQLLSTFMLQE